MQGEELRHPGIIATSDSLTTPCRPLSLDFDSCHSRAPALITCMESSDRGNMLASRDLPQAKPGLERERWLLLTVSSLKAGLRLTIFDG